jgi:putative membrane protein insertion efficiency factor
MTKEIQMTRVQLGAPVTTVDSSFAIRPSSFVVRCFTLAIRVYQLTLSPAQTFLFGALGGCRHTPTCSVYAVEALREHGVMAGMLLAAKRICRCHPWGGCGPDPVPPKRRREAGGQPDGSASCPNAQRTCQTDPLRIEPLRAPGKSSFPGGRRPALRIQNSEARF